MRHILPPELHKAHQEIREIARGYGLDTFDIIFELVDYDEINEVAALGGYPTRYPHWRFGMEYDYLNKTYTYGLQKIYELVINNDPCYAYLQTGNAIVDQKLVMAHVYGHCDFFKNNMWFAKTNRKMLDEMANHATKIREYQDVLGVEVVEDFIDRCLSIDNLIDQYSVFQQQANTQSPSLLQSPATSAAASGVKRFETKDYLESFVNPRSFIDEQEKKIRESQEKARKFPLRPERDVLAFLINYAPLENWQREILSIIREEAYYFAPQAATKIMNEGWASYWHSTIMTQHVLKDSEVIDYADHHSGTVSTRPGQLNPYKLGIELFRDIEDRWNKGRFGKEYDECDDVTRKRQWDQKLGLGRQKVFEVRKLHNDVTFIDSFMNEEFCEQQKLFTYGFNRRTGQYEIIDRDWKKVKNQLLFSLSNFGQPVILVEDGNYQNRGELLLVHQHEGLDLEYDKGVETLKNIQAVWGRPVHVMTKYNSQNKLLSFDGKEVHEKDA
ncbi:MAG: SpoVR family protein [Proteobacteria bacterium]|nr:SpoVR family protein [Pseudomonadota bacterium]NDC23845.1 SpoVR family protein [Pseudomonadota bacterium]NDD04072.1 SpoVR family protein [Pseudomonadota bacterium]NDG25812.1 SpoVR family protein [Pseudomonadota bacterium]